MQARRARGETSWFDSEVGLSIFSSAVTEKVGERLSESEIRPWLSSNPLIIRILEAVVRRFLFLPPSPGSHTLGGTDATPCCGIIPSCEHPYLPKARFPTLLALPSVALLNSELPVEFRREWRFVYSSYLLGDSFTGLVKSVLDKGPTIIVVKARGKDEVFGGFAPTSWSIKPSWQGKRPSVILSSPSLLYTNNVPHSCFLFCLFSGTNVSFLFTLKPKLGVYRTTGYNDHYMYMNIGQETLPNGLVSCTLDP